MAILKLTSKSNVGIVVEALSQGGALAQRSESDRTRITADLRRIQAVYDDTVAAISEAASSGELTPKGQKAASDRAHERAVAALKPFIEKVTRLESAETETRSKALASLTARKTGVRTPEAALREREIRDRLTGKDPLFLAPLYFRAIEAGDWESVRAFESAPTSFPLIDANTRQRGEALLMEKSPFANEIATAAAEHEVYKIAVQSVQTEMAKMDRTAWEHERIGG